MSVTRLAIIGLVLLAAWKHCYGSEISLRDGTRSLTAESIHSVNYLEALLLEDEYEEMRPANDPPIVICARASGDVVDCSRDEDIYP